MSVMAEQLYAEMKQGQSVADISTMNAISIISFLLTSLIRTGRPSPPSSCSSDAPSSAGSTICSKNECSAGRSSPSKLFPSRLSAFEKQLETGRCL
jgi:hypothetical protein